MKQPIEITREPGSYLSAPSGIDQVSRKNLPRLPLFNPENIMVNGGVEGTRKDSNRMRWEHNKPTMKKGTSWPERDASVEIIGPRYSRYQARPVDHFLSGE
jgi:hypothetical protein